MATYDPDMNPEDFDPTDMEMVDGYLNHPNTLRLHEELGREFAASSPADQVDVLGPMLARALREREQIRAILSGEGLDADARHAITSLLDTKTEQIRATVNRIRTLSEQ